MYVIVWWTLDYISGEKVWRDDAGELVKFADREDAYAYMQRLYCDPRFEKLGFRIGHV